MKTLSFLFASIATGILVSAGGLLTEMTRTSTAQAAPQDLTMEIVPASVTLPVNGAVQVQVIVRNPNTITSTLNNLSTFTNAGVTAEIMGEQFPKEIAPGTDQVWGLTLSRSAIGMGPGTVHLRLDYIGVTSASPGASRVLFHSLETTDPALPETEKIADVKVETALTSINDRRGGRVYLAITNRSNETLRITKIQPHPVKYIIFAPESVSTIPTLAPHGVHVETFDVTAEESVQAGKYLLLYEVALEWGNGGSGQTATLIATQPIGVGVFGESEILAPLAVPSFIVLPGFLMVAVWGLLFRVLKPRGKVELPFKTLSAEFWLIAITLSLLMAFYLYPLLTERFNVIPRDYLDSYGFNDIAAVWAYSIIISGVAYLLIMGGWVLYKKYREQSERNRIKLITISQDDTPLETLLKLHRRGLKLNLEQVTLPHLGAEVRAFLLEGRAPDKERLWVAPRIFLNGFGTVHVNVQREIEDQLTENGNPGIIAKIVAANRTMNLAWDEQDSVGGVSQVQKDQIGASVERKLIVEIVE